jgi:diguanylate cyclase (GGDEF)-like protein
LLGITLASPLDVALLAALASLPLLFGVWVLVFGRTWSEARKSRQAQIRLAIANELGIRPRELVSVGTEALFKLREEAAFDELTGTLRRAAGMAALEREISRARRMRAPLSVVFIDLDGLKQANDRRGHKAGDELIRGLASLLKSGLRGQDLVTRYGGDEFVCVLPDTPADAARAKLSSIQAEADQNGIRFSTGAAQLERSDDLVSFLARADREMYEAKARRGEIRQLRPEGAPRADLRSQPELRA